MINKQKCCIVGCKPPLNTKMLRFPQNLELRSIWRRLIGPYNPGLFFKSSEGNLHVLAQRNVCQRHFEKKYFRGTRRIENAIPTLFTNEEIATRTPMTPIAIDFKKLPFFQDSTCMDHTYIKKQDLILHQNKGHEVLEKDPVNRQEASSDSETADAAAPIKTDIEDSPQRNCDFGAEKLLYDDIFDFTITGNKIDKPSAKQQRQTVIGKDKVNRPEGQPQINYIIEAEQFGNAFHNEKSTYTIDDSVDSDVEMTEMSIYVDNDNNDDIAISIDSAQTDDGKVPVIRHLQHDNISCNECHEDIHGYRYVCLECADYDLCSACEVRGVHDTHYVLRIPAPRPQKEIDNLLNSLRPLISLTNVENEDDLLSVKKEEEQEIELEHVADSMKSESSYLEDPLSSCITNQPFPTSHCINDQPIPTSYCTNDQTIPSSIFINDQLENDAVDQYVEIDTQPTTKSTPTDNYDSALYIFNIDQPNSTDFEISMPLQKKDDSQQSPLYTDMLHEHKNQKTKRLMLDKTRKSDHKANTKISHNLRTTNKARKCIVQSTYKNKGFKFIQPNRDRILIGISDRQSADLTVRLSRLSQAEIDKAINTR